MKKFVLLYVGSVKPTHDVMDGWTKWFAALGDRVVDSGNPFGAGKEVTKSGSKDLAMDTNSIAGYTIVNAENAEEIEQLVAKECPMVTGVKIYEALPM
jgi:hypothetical protein